MSDPLWLELRATGRLAGRPAIYYETVDSTNTAAMALGRQGAASGTVVVAEQQSAGRGRLARQWLSPPGCGLYFSLLLRPHLAPEELARITLAVGVAVCRALEQTTALAPQLKWPNDILLHGGKCGGILTEAEFPGNDQPPLVVVGIGLNVTTPAAALPVTLRQKATSLFIDSGRHHHRGALLLAICREIDRIMEQLVAGDFGTLLAEWRQRDGLAGQRLAWLTPQHTVVHGVSLGPDQSGALSIRDDAGTIHTVISGDISLAAPSP